MEDRGEGQARDIFTGKDFFMGLNLSEFYWGTYNLFTYYGQIGFFRDNSIDGWISRTLQGGGGEAIKGE